MSQFSNLETYHPVLSAEWWRAAGIRALRTALIVATTYLPATYTEAVPILVLASAAAMAGVLSLITSLAGLAEVNAVSVPWPIAIFIRVVKTIAQALVSGVLANVIFIQDIQWETVLATTISAGFGSLLLGALKTLPETTDPIAPVTIQGMVTDSKTGETTVGTIPAVTPVQNPGNPGA